MMSAYNRRGRVVDYSKDMQERYKAIEPSKKDWKLYRKKISGWQKDFMEIEEAKRI